VKKWIKDITRYPSRNGVKIILNKMLVSFIIPKKKIGRTEASDGMDSTMFYFITS